jgi:hypothetical protein
MSDQRVDPILFSKIDLIYQEIFLIAKNNLLYISDRFFNFPYSIFSDIWV